MKTFDIISPVNGSIFQILDYTSLDEARQIVTKAQNAQIDWASKPLKERQSICKTFIQEMLNMADETAVELTYQMGRPVSYGTNELNGLAERSSYMIERSSQGLAPLDVSDKNAKRRIDRVPLGVTLIVAPWNYPFLTAVNTIIPAILAGNSVILKPAGQTALTGQRFADAFRKSGLPDGVFQTLLSSHDVTANLIKDGGINFIAFTGSVRGGTEIERTAAGKFLPITLELGGKDPAYVREDADLENTVASLVDGSFFNSGQSCCGIERIYVAKKRFEDFVSAFAAETFRTQKLGNPLEQDTTLGPVVSSKAAADIGAQIASAINNGAETVTGRVPTESDGCYLEPTTLVSVNHSMDFMTEETFGPCVGIMPVADDDEALHLMNDSRFGLSASIWSTDKQKAEAFGRQVRTGTVFVNRCDYLDPRLAWTGIKESGRGCSLSELGFHHVTRPKSYYIG